MLLLSTHRPGADGNPTSCPLHPDSKEAALLQTITSFSPAHARVAIKVIFFTTPVTKWGLCHLTYFSPQLDMPCQKRSKNCVQLSQLIPFPWKDLGKVIWWTLAWDAIVNSDLISLRVVELPEVCMGWCAAHSCWQILSRLCVFQTASEDNTVSNVI